MGLVRARNTRFELIFVNGTVALAVYVKDRQGLP
jgi:hypothetical protein